MRRTTITAGSNIHRNITIIPWLPGLVYWNVTEFDVNSVRPFVTRTLARGFSLTSRKAHERAMNHYYAA